MVRQALSLAIIVVVSLLSVSPLFHSGLIPTHDGEYHVVRFAEFYKTLFDGNWYPRWASELNNGYGVPLFNYVYPLPNYASALFHFLGASFIDAFKLNLIAASVIGGIGVFLFCRAFSNTYGGVTAAAVYLFAPYRLVDIYVRGSVGEVWALAIAPFVLFFLTQAFHKESFRYTVLSGIAFALLIFSHNILALLLTPLVLSYVMIVIAQNRKALIRAFIFIGIGLGLSAIFWIPALFEKRYVTGLQVYDVNVYFPELYQLIFPTWGSGLAEGDIATAMSYQIGIVNLLIVTLSFVFTRALLKRYRRHVIFFLLWFFLSVFLILPNSAFLWNSMPLLSFAQFPWRFLSLVILLCSFLAALVVATRGRGMLWAAGVSVAAIVSTITYIKPAYYLERDDAYYLTRPNFINGTNSPGNAFQTRWIGSVPEKRDNKVESVENEAHFVHQYYTSTDYRFSLLIEEQTRFRINTAYFPGWKGWANGRPLSIVPTAEGAMLFILPEGAYSIHIQFVDTIVRRIATVVTALTASVVVLFWLVYRKNEDWR